MVHPWDRYAACLQCLRAAVDATLTTRACTGDVSGQLDLESLGILMAQRTKGVGVKGGAGQAVTVQIVRRSSGRAADAGAGGEEAAEAAEAGCRSDERLVEIGLGKVCWPLVPPERFDEKQLMLEMGCRLANATCIAGTPPPAPTKIKRHKQIKSNPFDLMLQTPQDTEVAGRWQLAQGTHGRLCELACLLPFDPPGPGGAAAHDWATLDVSGGPWQLKSTRLECNAGLVLRVGARARVSCSQSLVQGAPSSLLPPPSSLLPPPSSLPAILAAMRARTWAATQRPVHASCMEMIVGNKRCRPADGLRVRVRVRVRVHVRVGCVRSG